MTAISFCIMLGCAGPNSSVTTTNIEKAAAIDSAFVPGAAIIGVPMLAVDAVKYFANSGKPKLKKFSPQLLEITKSSPFPVFDETCTKVVQWLPSFYIDDNGKRVKVTSETASQISRDYGVVLSVAGCRYRLGDFGDEGPEAVKKNLEAWRDGKLVVAEYNGPNGVKVVVVSDKNEPAEMMLPVEWEARKSQYGLTQAKPVIPVEGKANEGNQP
jgi:hypothetical protein